MNCFLFRKKNKVYFLNSFKKGIDPLVNKIVSRGKKWKKMFHVLHKVDMCACYAKQKINLAYPNIFNFCMEIIIKIS